MNLRAIVNTILKDNAPDSSVKELIFLCRKIALVHLRRKASTGRLLHEISSMPLDDLAIDCIADLFQRDCKGNIVQIRSYFEGLPVKKMSDEDILSHLRRLIFSRVNQSIFRINNEIDPSLGKIIRNIKLAIQTLHNFDIKDRFGENCIVPSNCVSLEHLPVVENTDLERALRKSANGSESIPEMLAILSRYLREQEEHSRILSLTMTALIFRSIYADRSEYNTDEIQAEDQFIVGDAKSIIHDVCLKIKSGMGMKYASKKNIDLETLGKYFDVIEDNLYQTIINRDGEKFSFFECMKLVMPGVEKEEYCKRHKSRIEYLHRITQKSVIKELKKNI